jgi:hypothetical protein
MAFSLPLVSQVFMPSRRPQLPLAPRYPERTCWGCDKYCPAEELRCGNGTIRAPHPVELFGPGWSGEQDPPGTD